MEVVVWNYFSYIDLMWLIDKSIFVLQFCPGGELFDYIVAKEKLSVSHNLRIHDIYMIFFF